MDIIMNELLGTPFGLSALITLAAIVGIGLFIWYRLEKNSRGQD